GRGHRAAPLPAAGRCRPAHRRGLRGARGDARGHRRLPRSADGCQTAAVPGRRRLHPPAARRVVNAALRSTASRRGVPLRMLWMLPAGLALLAGLDAGMLLLGLPAPVTTDRLPEVHGMLLALGFVGTL